VGFYWVGGQEVVKAIFVFHGVSGSGKSEACRYFQKQPFWSGLYLHPITHAKTFLEDTYDLPRGFLETREGKEYHPPGVKEGYTLHDLLVDFYHFMKERDPLYSTRKFKGDILEGLKNDRLIVTQAIRNVPEVEMLLEEFAPFLYVFYLTRDTVYPKSSDADCERLLEMFRKGLGDHRVIEIENNYSDLKPYTRHLDQVASSLLNLV
jgi:hypothetical protein